MLASDSNTPIMQSEPFEVRTTLRLRFTPEKLPQALTDFATDLSLRVSTSTATPRSTGIILAAADAAATRPESKFSSI